MKKSLLSRWALPISAAFVLAALIGWYLTGPEIVHPSALLIQRLEKSNASREARFIQTYKDLGIPFDLCLLAAHVDRIEDDIAQASVLLKNEKELTEEATQKLSAYIKDREKESRQLIKDNHHILDKYAEKSRRDGNSTIMNLIHVLRSQSFTFEREF